MKIPIPSLLFIILSLNLHAQSVDYGKATKQNEILNMDCLHDRGFTGKGVTIAHFDDGYDGFHNIDAFKYAYEEGYVKGNYDFVFDGPIPFEGVGSHGTNTVSVVHAYLPGQFVGTAYNANILLAHTEDNRTEKHIEEKNWRKAVDWAIENGADIITSSLQYNTFDQGEGDYTYADLDGNTTIITKAADYAASKGILVVAIQGNFGNDKWHYLAAPGDADSVITVGALNIEKKKAGFSSYGPSADGRIKPDVMAVGWNTYVIDPNDVIRTSSGTSFAGPAIAGLAACLKEAHPQRSNMEIISAIRQSGDRYWTPNKDDGYGYGIPDACKADDLLRQMDVDFDKKVQEIDHSDFRFKVGDNQAVYTRKGKKKAIQWISIVDPTEKIIYQVNCKKKKWVFDNLSPGHYLLKGQLKNKSYFSHNFVVK